MAGALASPCLESANAKKERVQKAFADLESHRVAIAACTIAWKELEEHFSEVERTLNKRFEELASKEKAFEAKSQELQDVLDKRDEAVAAREQASLSRVQEQKDSAIAAIFEEKRKWTEERQRMDAEAAAAAAAAKAAAAAAAAAASAKAAQLPPALARESPPIVSHAVVAEATKPESSPPPAAAAAATTTTTTLAVASSPARSPAVAAVPIAAPTPASQAMEVDFATPKPAAIAADSDLHSKLDAIASNGPASKDAAGAGKTLVPDVRVRPQLKSLCESMDGDGLRKYIVDHRKDVGVLRAELPSALQCAIDPARLVLCALEGYHLPEPGANSNQGADKKESGASANRRACILLLECLAVVLADPVLGADHPVVPSNIKDSAKEVADQWRSKMTVHGDAASGNSLDAQAFLQLLATFGIAPEYNDDELCKLVTAVARRRQSPALCRSLGLSAKIPDVVDRLAKEGKQIEALSFAHSFGIMDRVQPVPLLKTYLKEARKTAQSILKSGNSSAAAQNDATMKELAALKSVLKCIEEYQLESSYPSSPLQKRVVQLEKAKSDRKRAAVAVKAQTKRPRASSGTGGGYGGSNVTERSYYRSSERSPYGGLGVSSYSIAAQSNYDRRSQAAYNSGYAGGSRSPVSLSSSYLYSTDGLGSPVYGSAAYSNPTATYSSYQFGSGLPPPPPAYQASFLH